MLKELIEQLNFLFLWITEWFGLYILRSSLRVICISVKKNYFWIAKSLFSYRGEYYSWKPCYQGFEYADFIHCWLVRHLLVSYPGYLGMIQNCIRWWAFNSEDLGSLEYSFIAVTPSLLLLLDPLWIGVVVCKNPIYRSNRFVLKIFSIK